jgi:hypothetical protein
MAAIESDFGHYFANNAQNYLTDFLRRRHGNTGSAVKHIDPVTGKLDGTDDFYVVQRPVEGNRLMFEIHAINDKGA